MTGATDENGVLVELSGFDIERLPRAEIDAYNERRAGRIASRRDAAREADDFGRYEEAFVSAGGDPKDARAAFEAQKRSRAAEEAGRANTEALQASRRRIRKVL